MNLQSVSRALRTIAAAAVVVALCLGVTVVSGCEFVYLPECDNDCTAGGGDDSYGKGTP